MDTFFEGEWPSVPVFAVLGERRAGAPALEGAVGVGHWVSPLAVEGVVKCWAHLSQQFFGDPVLRQPLVLCGFVVIGFVQK